MVTTRVSTYVVAVTPSLAALEKFDGRATVALEPGTPFVSPPRYCASSRAELEWTSVDESVYATPA